MDKTVRVILSIGISILFPLVVYFAVVTVLPSNKSTSRYPESPRCSQSTYNSYDRSYDTDFDCKRQYEEHDKKVAAYNDDYKKDDKLNVTRAQVALVLAVLTTVGVFFARSIKEVAAGLMVGSAMTVIGAVSVMFSDYSGDDSIQALNSLLSILGFLAMTGIMYAVEKSFPNRPPNEPVALASSVQTVAPPAPQSHPAEPPQHPSPEQNNQPVAPHHNQPEPAHKPAEHHDHHNHQQ